MIMFLKQHGLQIKFVMEFTDKRMYFYYESINFSTEVTVGASFIVCVRICLASYIFGFNE